MAETAIAMAMTVIAIAETVMDGIIYGVMWEELNFVPTRSLTNDGVPVQSVAYSAISDSKKYLFALSNTSTLEKYQTPCRKTYYEEIEIAGAVARAGAIVFAHHAGNDSCRDGRDRYD